MRTWETAVAARALVRRSISRRNTRRALRSLFVRTIFARAGHIAATPEFQPKRLTQEEAQEAFNVAR